MDTKVSYKRHLAKTITYRILGTATTMILSLVAGLPIKWAALVGVGEIILKPIIYFLHERMWYKWIKFGLIVTKEKRVVNRTKKETTTTVEKKPKTKKLNYSSNR